MHIEQSRVRLNVHIYPSTFENESRILKVTKSLIVHNIVTRVLVIAMAKCGLPTEQCIDDVRNVLRVKTRLNGTRLWSKILRFAEWSTRVVMRLRHEVVDMVNCHSLSVLPLCVILKWCHKCILVYEPHELETESDSSKGLRKMLAKIVERILTRFVDQTFVVSESIAGEYARMYKMIAPPVVLNCPNYSVPVQSNLLRTNLGIPLDAVIFLYQGCLAFGRGVHVILEVFKNITDTRKVIVFMGYGSLEEEIKKSSHKYKNIYLHPVVTPEEVFQYTASADIGISIIENSCLSYYYCMPNKLFEYCMAGLPIIVSNMYEMACFVKKFNTGVVACDESPAALIEAIDVLLKMDLTALKKNALEAAKQFCWEEQEKIMISAYRKLFSRE